MNPEAIKDVLKYVSHLNTLIESNVMSMEEAIREGIPVFLDIESLERWYKEIGTSVPADGNNTR